MNWKGLTLALMLPLALSVAGCQTAIDVFNGSIDNPVTPKLALQLDAGFTAGVVVAAADYAALPRCMTPPKQPCSQQAVVNQLRVYVGQANKAVVSLDDWANGNTKLDGPALYSAAVLAISAAESYAVQNGMNFTRETK